MKITTTVDMLCIVLGPNRIAGSIILDAVITLCRNGVTSKKRGDAPDMFLLRSVW